MYLRLINNPDESKKILYKIARVVYAETSATSLPVVEALTAMIKNCADKEQKDFADIVSDKNLFESLSENSLRHSLLKVEVNNRGFQMCLRTVQRMLNGNLPDKSNGATRFHRCDVLPDWAVARGYIADIDGLLFYL